MLRRWGETVAGAGDLQRDGAELHLPLPGPTAPGKEKDPSALRATLSHLLNKSLF